MEERRFLGVCGRLRARLAAGDAAGAATGNALITRYIARKLQLFGVADAELRQTVAATLHRRFRDTMTCCGQV